VLLLRVVLYYKSYVVVANAACLTPTTRAHPRRDIGPRQCCLRIEKSCWLSFSELPFFVVSLVYALRIVNSADCLRLVVHVSRVFVFRFVGDVVENLGHSGF